jgi:flavin reductase (DIM6/NTAB) family NADH-FMN oxidoreductase RutF
MSQEFDQKELRQVFGSFVTGVTVVTATLPNGQTKGFTANSFTSVSLAPPLVLVCLANTSNNFEDFKNNDSFAINILSEQQQEISNTFASPVEDRFAQVSTSVATTGAPIIDDCSAWLDCSSYECYPGGDHIILIGEVKAYGDNNHGALGYYKGAYMNFGLSREAAMVGENSSVQSAIGVLLERDDQLLLWKNEGTGVSLPLASQLSGDKGLINKLSVNGLDAEIGFLYAVFEDEENDISYTYYRGGCDGELNTELAYWCDIDAIPFEQIGDAAARSMITRYVQERSADAFGVYIGGTETGKVGVLKP